LRAHGAFEPLQPLELTTVSRQIDKKLADKRTYFALRLCPLYGNLTVQRNYDIITV